MDTNLRRATGVSRVIDIIPIILPYAANYPQIADGIVYFELKAGANESALETSIAKAGVAYFRSRFAQPPTHCKTQNSHSAG